MPCSQHLKEAIACERNASRAGPHRRATLLLYLYAASVHASRVLKTLKQLRLSRDAHETLVGQLHCKFLTGAAETSTSTGMTMSKETTPVLRCIAKSGDSRMLVRVCISNELTGDPHKFLSISPQKLMILSCTHADAIPFRLTFSILRDVH